MKMNGVKQKPIFWNVLNKKALLPPGGAKKESNQERMELEGL